MSLLDRTAAAALLISASFVLAQTPTSQPEFTTLKSAFVPGDRTIFYDDFTDMAPDSPPPHFKVRGGAPELRASGDARALAIVTRGSLFPNITALPKNFTLEADLLLSDSSRNIFNIMFSAGPKQILHVSNSFTKEGFDLVASLRAPYAELGRKRVPALYGNSTKLAIWYQDSRLRIFLNGDKQLDFNQVDLPGVNAVEFACDPVGAGKSFSIMSVRIAESTPDFSQSILSGRYSTNGILFDVNSDRIKPESAPIIQAIARGLAATPALKVRIEGHTDSTGNASANLDLSKRRAEAVKSVLATQFQIDAARMTTAGLGATKPADANDTPQGRARNRRVDFVRQ